MSNGTKKGVSSIMRTAELVTLLRSGEHTQEQLIYAIGGCHHSVAPVLRAFALGGHVRTVGKRGGATLWSWVEA